MTVFTHFDFIAVLAEASILLFLNDQLLHFLPERAFDPGQFADVRATIIASEVLRS